MNRSLLRQVMSLFRWERRPIARFLAATLARAALTSGTLWLIQEFLAGALGSGGGRAAALAMTHLGRDGAIAALAATLLACYIASSVASYQIRIEQQRLVQILEIGILERLLRHLVSLPLSFHERSSQGDLVQLVRGDVNQLRSYVLAFATTALEAVMAVGLLALAVALSPTLAFWALGVMPLAAYPMWKLAQRTLQRSYDIRKTGNLLLESLLQLLRGLRIVKAYRAADAQTKVAVERGREFFDNQLLIVSSQAASQVVLESLAGLGIVVVILVGGLEVTSGRLSWPTLMAFIMTIRALHGPLNNVNTFYVQLQAYRASVDRIAEMLDTRSDMADRPDARPLRKAPAAIKLDGVTFGYDPSRPILRDISVELAGGETIGIVGPSGAGKSTLLNLIARFYDPGAGRVLFDGEDVRGFRIDDVHALFAIVTQEPFLFSMSVRDNIRLGRPDASHADVEAAARAAFIHEEIQALPAGYETMLGSGGRSLSGGQAQRVNVARAILKNAPILLLDEATSSLDSVAEQEVQKALDRLIDGRTTFIVAHRLSTLRGADRILVLAEGGVAGFDAHERLIETCPVYRRLWEAQSVDAPAASAPPPPLTAPSP